jgi:hypothetical protein
MEVKLVLWSQILFVFLITNFSHHLILQVVKLLRYNICNKTQQNKNLVCLQIYGEMYV